jgi:hypothetical protein
MLLSTGLLTGVVGVPVAEDKASISGLLRQASVAGYGRLPLWQMLTLQRTAEFYAAGATGLRHAG